MNVRSIEPNNGREGVRKPTNLKQKGDGLGSLLELNCK